MAKNLDDVYICCDTKCFDCKTIQCKVILTSKDHKKEVIEFMKHTKNLKKFDQVVNPGR